MMRQAVTRRHVLKMGVASLGLATGAIALRGSVTSAQQNLWFRPTADLNLREQPNLNARVLAVIPANSLIRGTDELSNGFRRVVYNDITGWAYDEYLAESNGPSPGPGPIVTGEAHTNTDANFRSGPGTNYSVIQVLPFGVTVGTTDTVQNGFRLVVYNGTQGWIFDELLDPIVDPGEPGQPMPANGTVTTPLNLRDAPSLSGKVLTVMPEGARVYMGDEVQNGYRRVQYMGINGWAADIYLRFDFDPGPQPVANGTVTTDLNLRHQPDLSSGVITVMPAGARLVMTDIVENGFRFVNYMGTDGWAWDEFLLADDDVPGLGDRARVTTGLNLREEPDLSADVLLVMPEGALVTIEGANQNGFTPVTYQGTFGWAWAEYLKPL